MIGIAIGFPGNSGESVLEVDAHADPYPPALGGAPVGNYR
jgi:hypothetical protein